MRRAKLLLCCVSAFALLAFHTRVGDCWQAETHKRLTDAAAWNAQSFSGTWPYYDFAYYLTSWHGIDADTVIKDKTVRKWIRDGSADEDKPANRSFYHFHDPLKPWDKAGLSAMGLSWKSSILWSQTPIGQQQTSWKNARQYFYKALSAPTDGERQQAYAVMFKSLGHIMHLVEDAAVPDHTRNDVHLVFSVEKWVEVNIEQASGYIPQSFDAEELLPLFGLPANPLAPVQIARLIDSDQYTGTNPEITVIPVIGLAEYSNANFLSLGTIFTYAHPSLASTEPGKMNGYLRKSTAGEKVEHFVLAGPDWPAPQERTYDLDDRCYEDYAKLLLPKAAKYAAAIPHYFFRAAFGTDYGSDLAGRPFSHVWNASDEVMKDGIVEIHARTSSGSWKRLGQAPIGYLAAGEEMTVYLDCNDCMAEYPGMWTIVFRGTLGNEKEAVVGHIWTTPL